MNFLYLYRSGLGALVELLNIEVQFIPHFLQAVDQGHQVCGIIEIVPNFVQRQPKVLQAAYAAQLGKRIDPRSS